MVTTPLLVELEAVRRSWGWLLALGIAMIVLGIVALWMIPVATMAAVMVLGWVMVISGVVEAIHAFRMRGWGGTSLHFVAGILGVLVGLAHCYASSAFSESWRHPGSNSPMGFGGV